MGAPMWAHRPWVGRHFPGDTPPGQELVAYATWCTAVEGNTTFYALPSPASVARWADQTPASFRFCCKLPRTITHERRLRDAGEELEEALRRLDPLGPRLGPTLIQLPGSFGPEDLDVLAGFCHRLPADRPWAVEVRHPGFFAGGGAERPLDDLLTGTGINRVILDSRALFDAPPRTPAELEAWDNKPRLPVRPIATADQPVVRLIGQSDTEADLARWEPWWDRIVGWVGRGCRPIVFTHTPDNLDAPALARAVHAKLAARIPDLAPLPEPVTDGEQLGLF
ncbi:MAG: DUF72 domain-containing protein [Acidimicrobiales bacterium]